MSQIGLFGRAESEAPAVETPPPAPAKGRRKGPPAAPIPPASMRVETEPPAPAPGLPPIEDGDFMAGGTCGRGDPDNPRIGCGYAYGHDGPCEWEPKPTEEPTVKIEARESTASTPERFVVCADRILGSMDAEDVTMDTWIEVGRAMALREKHRVVLYVIGATGSWSKRGALDETGTVVR